MPRFLVLHRHEPRECGAAYRAWKGFDSPLRKASALTSCLEGGHIVWVEIEALDANRAIEQLPPFVAARSIALPVSEVAIP